MRSLLVACLLLGCASSARLTGSFDDYSAYRRARVAGTREERLGASFDYLSAFPRGDYRAEVRAWFTPAEERYFRLAQDNPARLRAYLKFMPHGPHAEQVAERLAELDTRRVFAERREARMLAKARDVQTALTEADRSRRELIAEWMTLVRLVAAVRSFGEPTSALDSDLIWQFRLREPRGRCEQDLCRKLFHFEYTVPGERQLAVRSADITLELVLERGALQSVSLSGPRLFNRLSEAVELRLLDDSIPDRKLSLERSLELVENAIGESFPEASCAAPAAAPLLLVRRCAGAVLELEAGSDGIDRLRVHPDGQR